MNWGRIDKKKTANILELHRWSQDNTKPIVDILYKIKVDHRSESRGQGSGVPVTVRGGSGTVPEFTLTENVEEKGEGHHTTRIVSGS